MSLTCLQIIQTVCKRIGILAPNIAVASTDPQIQQIVAICEEEGQELAARYAWEALQQTVTFLTVASGLQYQLADIAPNLNYVVNDTIWNRTLRRPVYGPKNSQEWQESIANNINGPFNAYRIMRDALFFYPTPVAGQTCAFEYISRAWINSGTGSSATWLLDTDTPKLDDQIITLGTVWRWKQAKGLDYAEDFAKYERRIMDAMGRDASKPILNTAGASWEIQPAILVPRGSFGVN